MNLGVGPEEVWHKGMTRLARCAFFHPRDLISWERWLAEHPLEPSAVTARLVTLVVTQLGDKLQVHGAFLARHRHHLGGQGPATPYAGRRTGVSAKSCHFPLAVRCPAKFTLLDGTCDFFEPLKNKELFCDTANLFLGTGLLQ